jgi:hypothetical protein
VLFCYCYYDVAYFVGQFDSFFRRVIVCLSLHLRSCLRIELTMLIRGWFFSLLISNQSKGGVIGFVAVCLPALFTFLKNSVYSIGVLSLVAVSSFRFLSVSLYVAFVVSLPIIFSQSVLVMSFFLHFKGECVDVDF